MRWGRFLPAISIDVTLIKMSRAVGFMLWPMNVAIACTLARSGGPVIGPKHGEAEQSLGSARGG
jgi:hypothetical protein